MEKRKLEVEKFAQELGVETGLTSEEFKNNFVDKGHYIELNRPIGNMRIIVKKECRQSFTPYDYKKSIENSWNSYNLKNLHMATIDEMKIIYKIKDFLKDCCKMEKFEPNQCCWSSTIRDYHYVQYLDFSSGKVDEFCLVGSSVYFLLVR